MSNADSLQLLLDYFLSLNFLDTRDKQVLQEVVEFCVEDGTNPRSDWIRSPKIGIVLEYLVHKYSTQLDEFKRLYDNTHSIALPKLQRTLEEDGVRPTKDSLSAAAMTDEQLFGQKRKIDEVGRLLDFLNSVRWVVNTRRDIARKIYEELQDDQEN